MYENRNENRSTVVGVFENRDQVHCAEEALRNAGFRDDQIGIVMRNQPGTTGKTGTKAAEGAAGGVVAGGVVGGLLGAAASLLLPGVGPIVAGGILATTLAGAATGAVAGGILGTLAGLGVPEEEARFYDEEFRSGRIIVTAKADGRFQEAYQLLRGCGAYDMQSRHASMSSDDRAIRLHDHDKETRDQRPLNREGDTSVYGAEDTTDEDLDTGEGI